ncbi:hypothetical protein Taro_032798 [Colocasia esculenta]|uniref:Uncharacterized protein n=1 Tax=Colocasia esculenta TaxID=4460 RepID=A0A843WAI2_COLES|nr:hypothetical protein [Colocasia esculenta]
MVSDDTNPSSVNSWCFSSLLVEVVASLYPTSESFDHLFISSDIAKILCSTRIEGIFRSVESIKQSILATVRKTMAAVNFSGSISPNHAFILQSFNIQVSVRIKASILVKWNPPIVNYSLNVDGASKDVRSLPALAKGTLLIDKGHVEELLVAEELWNAHTKPFFFPFSSAATCTNRPLEVEQRCRPCECDDPIGRVLRSCRHSKPVTF